jgi:hypothetical protein
MLHGTIGVLAVVFTGLSGLFLAAGHLALLILLAAAFLLGFSHWFSCEGRGCHDEGESAQKILDVHAVAPHLSVEMDPFMRPAGEHMNAVAIAL